MIALENKIVDLSPPSIALFLPPNHQSLITMILGAS
jgi:hypothetical protein